MVMNMFMFKDLSGLLVSVGNSMFLMVMMLLMSLGVVVVGVLLMGFIDFIVGLEGCDMLVVFYKMFVCVGVMMCVVVWIFV